MFTRTPGIPFLAAAWVVATGFSYPAHAVLQGRDLNGSAGSFEAYYDTVLDITWLADANYGAGSAYDDSGSYTGSTTDGRMSWDNAKAWVANLNPYGSGITGWRLPTTNPIDGTTLNDNVISYIGTEDRGYNVSAPGTLYAGSTASEMAHLFYNTLGNKAYCDPATSTVSSCSGPQPGWGLTNTGPFSNVPVVGNVSYWSDTEYALDASNAWAFSFKDGSQSGTGTTKIVGYKAWAVHSGDVGAVPEPEAWGLMLSGLALVGAAARRRRMSLGAAL